MQLKAHADRYIRRTPLIRNRLWSAILSKTKKKQKRTNKQTGKEHRIILVYILLLDIVGILLLEIAFYLPLTPTKLPRLETLDLQKTYTGEKHFPFWKYEILLHYLHVMIYSNQNKCIFPCMWILHTPVKHDDFTPNSAGKFYRSTDQ